MRDDVPPAPAEVVRDAYGRRGAPLRRTPFLFGLAAAAGALITITGFAAIRTVAGVLTLVLFAMFIAIGLNRPVVAMVRRGMPRPWAVLAIVAAAVLALCGGVAALVPIVVEQAGQLFAAVPDFLQDLADSPLVARLDQQSDLSAKLTGLLTPENVAGLVGGILGGAQSVLSTLANMVLVAVLSLFFLAGYERLRRGAYSLAPASRRERVTLLGDAVLRKIGNYLAGSVAIACIAGAATAGWALTWGIPYSALLAVVVAVLDMIPQIGASIGAVVVSLVALSVSLPTAIATVLFYCAYQALENWLIYPRVMHRAVHISNLAAIVSVLIGGSLLGVLGVLTAVPAYAAIQLIIREVVKPRQDQR